MKEPAKQQPSKWEEGKSSKYTYLRQIETFMGHLEMGDLATTAMVLYGFVLYGMTRIGKTATSHLLAGNLLKGIKVSGQDMVNIVTNKNISAKIGNSMNSETVIPNKFEIKNYTVDGIHPACVIDTPGYGDTYGVLRILANGYFHYRLYSKIQNMKFIICFEESDLSGTGQKILETIMQWTKSFNNYFCMKQKLWDSCCFLFTKAAETESPDTIKERLQALVKTVKTQLRPEDQMNIKQFIQYMIEQDKIFLIKKYRQGQSSNAGQLLSQIDKKIKTWWYRDLNPEKPDEVDMSDIAFSLGKDVVVETVKNEISRDQLAELVSIYTERISEFVTKSEQPTGKCSIADVMDGLVNDALGNPNSHDFLDMMQVYVNKYHPDAKRESKQDGFKEQRKKYEKAMFETHTSLSKSKTSKDSNEQKKTKTKNFPTKKLSALKKMEELMQEINRKDFQGRDIKWLQECEKILIEMMRTFGIVGYKKKDRQAIIYRYGYLIHRLVEEAKVFVLLLEKFSIPKVQQQIKDACNGKVIELFRPLKDLMGIGFAYNDKDALTYDEVHQIYVNKFDPDSKENLTLELTDEFVNIFTNIEVEDNETKLKVSKIVERYSAQILNDKTKLFNQIEYCKMVEKLVKARNNCHELYQLSQDKKEKDRAMQLVKKLSKNLGKALENMKQYELARKAYDSVRQVDSVCLLYDSQIKDLDNAEQPSFKIRIAYAKYLMTHIREADAIKLLQQTYDMTDSVEDLDIVSQQMIEAMLAIREKPTTNYESNMFNKHYIDKMDDDTLNELQKLYNLQKNQKEIRMTSIPAKE